MARRPRHIQTGELYEMVFRAKQGIPLPCTEYMNVLVTSRLALALKEKGISLCHFVFVGNHAHLLFVPHCKSRLRNFGAQLKSSLTRVIKRVLGYEATESLLLWEGRSSIMQILDIDMAKDRIVYLYCNPAKANLVKNISEYPGSNSWHAFLRAEPSVEAEVQIVCPHIPEKAIPPLERRKPKYYINLLRQHSEGETVLILQPNSWMKAFGIHTDEEVKTILKSISKRITNYEEQLSEERKQKGVRVMPRRLLTTQRPSISGRKPKKKERRIYFLSSCKQLRLGFIDYFKRFCLTCRELYQEWKNGTFPKTTWPPEAYIPQSP